MKRSANEANLDVTDGGKCARTDSAATAADIACPLLDNGEFFRHALAPHLDVATRWVARLVSRQWHAWLAPLQCADPVAVTHSIWAGGLLAYFRDTNHPQPLLGLPAIDSSSRAMSKEAVAAMLTAILADCHCAEPQTNLAPLLADVERICKVSRDAAALVDLTFRHPCHRPAVVLKLTWRGTHGALSDAIHDFVGGPGVFHWERCSGLHLALATCSGRELNRTFLQSVVTTLGMPMVNRCRYLADMWYIAPFIDQTYLSLAQLLAILYMASQSPVYTEMLCTHAWIQKLDALLQVRPTTGSWRAAVDQLHAWNDNFRAIIHAFGRYWAFPPEEDTRTLEQHAIDQARILLTTIKS